MPSAAQKSLTREGQVDRDVQHRGVLEAGGELVEAAQAGLADAGADAGEDAEHLAAGEVGEAELLQVGVDEGEVRCLVADGGQVSNGVGGGVPECSGSHARQPNGVGSTAPAGSELRSHLAQRGLAGRLGVGVEEQEQLFDAFAGEGTPGRGRPGL